MTCPHADQRHTVWVMWADDFIPAEAVLDNHGDALLAVTRAVREGALWAKAFRTHNEAYECVFLRGQEAA